GPSRPVQGADQLRAGAAHRAQEGRLPDPRLPRGRAQEVRQGQGPPFVPVLEALIVSLKFAALAASASLKRGAEGRPFLRASYRLINPVFRENFSVSYN